MEDDIEIIQLPVETESIKPIDIEPRPPVRIVPGDIVQVTALDHKLFPALCVVNRLKDSGCTAYFLVPSSVLMRMAPMFIKLEAGKYEKVGHVTVDFDPFD
jgi:hypothetical protein